MRFVRSIRAAAALVATLAATATASAQQPSTGTITGRVTDSASSAPLAGAQVLVPSTRQGTITDESGSYTLPAVQAGTVLVRVQRLGSAPVERTVTVRAGETTTLDVAMTPVAISLDEVVVTATGATRAREIGNAISTISGPDVERAPVTNTQQIIAGRSTGVTVLANSGQPGAGGTIRLRGVNSVSQGNNPIIYVDGVRIFNGNTPTSLAGRQGTLPLNDIAASDIERVEIVKGPAATTLYGTEASGGVIQIFTKRGRSGRAQWTAEAAAGVNNMGHVGPDSDPTGLFVNQCRGENLVNSAGKRFEDATCPASGSWLRNGPVQRYSLSVRGGTDDLGYYVAGNYGSEQGVLPVGGNKDGGFRSNFSFRPSPVLDFTLSSGYTRRVVQWVPDGNDAEGFMLNVSRGPNSNFKGSGCSDATVTCVVNDSLFSQEAYTKTDHFTTGFTVNYNPVTRFSNRLSVGFDYNNADIPTTIPFGYLRVPEGDLDLTQWRRVLITTDYAGTWKQPLGDNFTTATSVGGQVFDSRVQSGTYESRNFAGPGLPVLTSGSLRTIGDALDQRVINAGFFAQEVVGWKDRLFITGGLRVDGNSSFGRNFGLQAYPKVSASYVISDEPFWPRGVIETFKLRGAVGASGKAPGAFDAVRTWEPVAALNGLPGFTPSQVGNPDLGPERTREFEAGFDAGALDGRLGVNLTYYDQRTMDALVPVQLPPSLGFSNRQLRNVGTLLNSGLELALTGDILRRDNLGLTARLNYTSMRSRAGDIGGETLTIEALSRTYVKQGYPVPSYFGKKVMNPNAFADPVVQEDQFLGSAFPTKIISPSITLTLWQRLTVDALGEWQLGGHLLNALAYQNANLGVWQPCYDTQAKMRAAAAGDSSALGNVTALQRARCTQVSRDRDYSFWVEGTDFFKLRSVSITYALPARFIPGASSASISLAGRNLWTATGYSGTDPEVADFRDNAFSRRDYYNFPTYRTFLATLRVGF